MHQNNYVQVVGKITGIETLGERSAKRLIAWLEDDSGNIELVWFKGIQWIQKILQEGSRYLIFGKAGVFNNKPQITHPKIEIYNPEQAANKFLEPVYTSTEKLKARGLPSKQIEKLTATLLAQVSEKDITENLPSSIISELNLPNRFKAIGSIHFPKTYNEYERALIRLKFEELFIAQLRIFIIKGQRHKRSHGVIFEKVGDFFNSFYSNALPFELTNAQKRVVKEIRSDTAKGHQMNRLLQGDVGSG